MSYDKCFDKSIPVKPASMRGVELKKEFFNTKPLLMSTTGIKLQGFGSIFNDSNEENKKNNIITQMHAPTGNAL